MTHSSEPEAGRVWRPNDFEGLYLVSCKHVSRYSLPLHVVQGYHFLAHPRFGSYRVRYGRERLRYHPGHDLVWLQQPGEVFRPEALDDAPLSTAWLCFSPEYAEQLLSTLGAKELVLPHMHPPENLREPLLHMILSAVQAFEEPASHLEREGRLLDLLHAVLTCCSGTPPSEGKLGREHKAVRVVKEVLHHTPGQDLRLDDLARLAGLNKHYLMRVFRRDVGLSPHEYQTGLRVCLAVDKLAEGEKVAKVAQDLGFTDQAHLTNTFRRFTRTTPERFQRASLRAP